MSLGQTRRWLLPCPCLSLGGEEPIRRRRRGELRCAPSCGTGLVRSYFDLDAPCVSNGVLRSPLCSPPPLSFILPPCLGHATAEAATTTAATSATCSRPCSTSAPPVFLFLVSSLRANVEIERVPGALEERRLVHRFRTWILLSPLAGAGIEKVCLALRMFQAVQGKSRRASVKAAVRKTMGPSFGPYSFGSDKESYSAPSQNGPRSTHAHTHRQYARTHNDDVLMWLW